MTSRQLVSLRCYDSACSRTQRICKSTVHVYHTASKPKYDMRAAQFVQELAAKQTQLFEKYNLGEVERTGGSCNFCGSADTDMCVVFYCNSECQQKHWPRHKAACKASGRENKLVKELNDHLQGSFGHKDQQSVTSLLQLRCAHMSQQWQARFVSAACSCSGVVWPDPY